MTLDSGLLFWATLYNILVLIYTQNLFKKIASLIVHNTI